VWHQYDEYREEKEMMDRRQQRRKEDTRRKQQKKKDRQQSIAQKNERIARKRAWRATAPQGKDQTLRADTSQLYRLLDAKESCCTFIQHEQKFFQKEAYESLIQQTEAHADDAFLISVNMGPTTWVMSTRPGIRPNYQEICDTITQHFNLKCSVRLTNMSGASSIAYGDALIFTPGLGGGSVTQSEALINMMRHLADEKAAGSARSTSTLLGQQVRNSREGEEEEEEEKSKTMLDTSMTKAQMAMALQTMMARLTPAEQSEIIMGLKGDAKEPGVVAKPTRQEGQVEAITEPTHIATQDNKTREAALINREQELEKCNGRTPATGGSDSPERKATA
jgi:hypothetical protein